MLELPVSLHKFGMDSQFMQGLFDTDVEDYEDFLQTSTREIGALQD